MTPLPSRLAAVFSPTRRLHGADPATLVRAGGALGGLQWVVPRAELRYRRIAFPALAPRQREAAARIAVRRMEPDPHALAHVAWTGSTAHAWTWPGGAAALAGSDAGWIPESLLRAPPPDDGLRLVAQSRGVEGQAWRDGELQASQWWPSPPSREAWLRFARGCGVGPGGASVVPSPVSTGWSEPWGDAAKGRHASPALLERWAWIGGAALVAAALGWQVAGHLYWTWSQSRLDAELDALRARAAPLLEARERADAARDALLALQALGAGPSDYRLMAEVVAPLPPDARLWIWQREGDRLQATVLSADQDPRRYVTAYAGSDWLSDVVATPAQGTMGLAFELPPASGPAADAAAADAGAGR